jgi:hypothetical protein
VCERPVRGSCVLKFVSERVVCKTVDVTKCHACHANATSMPPSATPATQSAAAPGATNGAQVRHQIQPSIINATPATQNEG